MDYDRTLRAGDTWSWVETVAGYDAGAWTLYYTAKSAAGGFQIAASAAGVQHRVDVNFATTEAYQPGVYQVVRWAEQGAVRQTVDVQTWEVLPNVREGVPTQPVDLRSTAQRMLDATEAGIEKLLANTNETVQLPNGIAYTKRKLGDLISLRDKLRIEVAAEKRAAKLAAGLDVGGRLLVRG